MAQPADGSVIHDIGYQRYTGPRLGRPHAIRALFSHGLRTAFGLGRGAKAKIFPWFVAGLVLMTAVIVTAVRSQTGEPVITYVGFSAAMGLPLLLFLAAVAPELVCRDRRAGVLPLFFSRPLNRADYPMTRLAALAAAVWLVLGVPQLLMFAGGAFGTDRGMSGVWDEVGDFVPGLLNAGIYAVVLSAVALAVASLTGRRAFAAGAVVGVFLVTTPVVGVLSALGGENLRRLASLASPLSLLHSLQVWLFEHDVRDEVVGDFGPLYALAAAGLLGLSVVLLLARYRKVD